MIHAQNHEGIHVKVLVHDQVQKRVAHDFELQKLTILAIKKISWIKSLWMKVERFYIKHAKTDITQQRFFSAEVATMLKAGAPIHEALVQILLHSYNFKLSQAIYGAYQKLLQGSSIEEAFQGYPKIFTPTFLGFLRQSLYTGNLTQAFSQFSQYCEYRVRNNRNVSGNILPLMFSIVLAWSVTFFVKENVLKHIISEARLMADPLPFWTELFDQIAPWVMSYKAALPLIIIPYLFSRMMKSAWVARVPLLKKRIALMSKLQFLKVASISLKTGINIQSAFSVAGSVVENPYYKNNIQKALKLFSQGADLPKALKATQLFSALHQSLLCNSTTSKGLTENMDVIIEFLESELSIWDSVTGQAKKYVVLALIVIYLLITGLAVLYPLLGWHA